jgi:delta14-sterol reductase
MESLTIQNVAEGVGLWLGFVAFLFVLRKIVPGPVRAGQPLPDGTRKSYKLNGLTLFVIVVAVAGIGQATGFFPLAAVHRLFWPLLVAANLFAAAHMTALFVAGRRRNRARAVNDPGALRDWWFGPELNPEFWGIDLKMFGYVPSLAGVWVLNASFASAQWAELGHLTTRMVLYQSFFTIYILNAFSTEYGLLSMWDVIAENFGWMLVWGDYVLVPFFYCLVGWFVLRDTAPMAGPEAVALACMFALGLSLFRGANEQKRRFKDNPQIRIWGKAASTIDGKLLISGFWGIGRKLNYTGELLIYLSWTLCAGFASPIPYVLPLWLASLQVHRAWRDEQRCRAKYGLAWDEYRRKARFRMIPFIY